MDGIDIIKQIASTPKGFLASDAFLKIKGLIWTSELDAFVDAIEQEESALNALQVQLLTLQRDKKKCYKQMLELSMEVQNGSSSANSPLENCKNELETLSVTIDALEYQRDLFPMRVKAIEDDLFQRLIETLYMTLNEAQAMQKSVIGEIDELRSVLKEKWTLKFDLDAKMTSLDSYLHSVLSIEALDALDEALIEGKNL